MMRALNPRGETAIHVYLSTVKEICKFSILWVFLELWACMSKIHHLPKVTLEHYSSIWTRSSVVERYLQDGLREPKKPPSAYWKACV